MQQVHKNELIFLRSSLKPTLPRSANAGHVAMIQCLLELGANVNIKSVQESTPVNSSFFSNYLYVSFSSSLQPFFFFL